MFSGRYHLYPNHLKVFFELGHFHTNVVFVSSCPTITQLFCRWVVPEFVVVITSIRTQMYMYTVYVYVYIYIYMYVYLYVYIYACMYIYICMYVYIYMHVCILCMYVCIMYVCMYIDIPSHIFPVIGDSLVTVHLMYKSVFFFLATLSSTLILMVKIKTPHFVVK